MKAHVEGSVILIDDSWRPVIGTLSHNRSFTGKEITEYTRFDRRLNGRSVVYRLLKAGLIKRVPGEDEDGRAFVGFTPTPAGWDWLETMQEEVDP